MLFLESEILLMCICTQYVFWHFWFFANLKRDFTQYSRESDFCHIFLCSTLLLLVVTSLIGSIKFAVIYIDMNNRKQAK